MLRRHLTEGQKAAIAEKIANLKNGSNRFTIGVGIPTAITREKAAEKIANLPHGGDRNGKIRTRISVS